MSSCSFPRTATTEIYTLSLHDALPICRRSRAPPQGAKDRACASAWPHLTPLEGLQPHHGRAQREAGAQELLRLQRSEEHTSELQSPYDLVCRLLLEKKKKNHHLSHAIR